MASRVSGRPTMQFASGAELRRQLILREASSIPTELFTLWDFGHGHSASVTDGLSNTVAIVSECLLRRMLPPMGKRQRFFRPDADRRRSTVTMPWLETDGTIGSSGPVSDHRRCAVLHPLAESSRPERLFVAFWRACGSVRTTTITAPTRRITIASANSTPTNFDTYGWHAARSQHTERWPDSDVRRRVWQICEQQHLKSDDLKRGLSTRAGAEVLGQF